MFDFISREDVKSKLSSQGYISDKTIEYIVSSSKKGRAFLMTKNNKRVDDLYQKLELLDEIDVIELIYEGQGQFSFKIATPIHTYLDSGTEEEILEICQRDISTAEEGECITCKRKLDYSERDGWGIMECKCGTIIGSIPKNLANHVVEKIEKKYGINGVYTVLKNWEKLYYEDGDTGCSWFRLQKDFVVEEPKVSLVCKPPTCSENQQVVVPVFGNAEDDDIELLSRKYKDGSDLPDDSIFRPICNYCKHAVTISNNQHGFGSDDLICVYPSVNEDFLNKLDIERLSFDREQWHCHDNNEAIIKSAFMKSLLEGFTEVDNQTRGREGLFSSPFNGFHGPICPQFSLDEKCMELGVNGGYLEEIGETTISFGIVNFEALEKEKAAEIKEQTRKNVLAKINSMVASDEKCKVILSQRVEIPTINSVQAKDLVKFLSSNFTLEELESTLPEGAVPMNASHKARGVILKRAIDALKPKEQSASKEFKTQEITKDTVFSIGSCGDAWALRGIGDPIDIIECRPFCDGNKTPVGICCDAPILVLYPERGSVDWEHLLQMELLPGKLCVGTDIKIIYLSEEDASLLNSEVPFLLTVERIKSLAVKSLESLQNFIANFKREFPGSFKGENTK